jgi:hypothetical protein
MRRSREKVQPSPTMISLSNPETENLDSSTEPLLPISPDIGQVAERNGDPLPSMVPDVEWSNEPKIEDIEEENSIPR